jgi:hypothetical protein
MADYVTACFQGDSYIEEIVLPAFNFPIAVMNASILTPSVKRIIFTTVAEALVPWGEDPQISFKGMISPSSIFYFC